MTILSPVQNPTPDGSDRLRPIFSVTADGFLAAQVRDTAFAMLPAREGGFFTATAWRISRPITEWKRSDFYKRRPSAAAPRFGASRDDAARQNALGHVSERDDL
jgi:hypothetical protein